jgi:uncharacterized protein (TIGR03067 family)
MRRFIFLPFLVLLLAADDPNRDSVTDDDQAALQGNWRAEKVIEGGRDVSAGKAVSLKLEFKGKQIIAHEKDRDEPAGFTLDPSKSPKVIHIKPKDAGAVEGIYELTGDTLKLCFARPGNGRPTKFASPMGQDVVLVILKREKK